MIVNTEQISQQKDVEILITYPEKTKAVESIISYLNSIDEKLTCYSEEKIKQINISDIYYAESIDKVTVVYCEKESYRTKYRLYQLYDKLVNYGFIQISKYCILNINKLNSIKPLLNSRMEAILENGARLYVTRKYLDGIESKLMEND